MNYPLTQRISNLWSKNWSILSVVKKVLFDEKAEKPNKFSVKQHRFYVPWIDFNVPVVKTDE